MVYKAKVAGVFCGGLRVMLLNLWMVRHQPQEWDRLAFFMGEVRILAKAKNLKPILEN